MTDPCAYERICELERQLDVVHAERAAATAAEHRMASEVHRWQRIAAEGNELEYVRGVALRRMCDRGMYEQFAANLARMLGVGWYNTDTLLHEVRLMQRKLNLNPVPPMTGSNM